MNEQLWSRASEYNQERQDYWDDFAHHLDTSKSWGGYYHRRLIDIYKGLVAPGQRVVEFGCGQGDLLSALRPSYGVGIDLSKEMIRRAVQRHPDLCFIQGDVHEVEIPGKFDVVILSDLLSDVWDIQKVFEQAARFITLNGRVIVNSYSRLWEIPLGIAQRLGIASPVLQRNWLTVEDITNLEYLANLEIIRSWQEITWPIGTPLIDQLFNRFIVKIKPFNQLGFTNFVLSRPKQETKQRQVFVSVIVPARNEAGNISQIFCRTPTMGSRTELVFVEGHSNDNTYETIQQAIEQNPDRPAVLLKQTGVGKGDAVRQGFSEAKGDVFMILDADLTVAPEELPRFYDALCSGKGDLVNGVRLVYPMEKQAMRFFNFLGNKLFTIAFSWLLGQPIKDTLCGTKALWKEGYEHITANRAYFGDFDPFGDYDLLFGAARLNFKIIDMPVRYYERKYGSTNIQRWKHGWLLLKMVIFAAFRIKFV